MRRRTALFAAAVSLMGIGGCLAVPAAQAKKSTKCYSVITDPATGTGIGYCTTNRA
jgi:hypothetical protein